jgi:hypothetical protein
MPQLDRAVAALGSRGPRRGGGGAAAAAGGGLRIPPEFLRGGRGDVAKTQGARDRELVRERTAGAATARAGTLRRRLAIVVGEQGEIDIGGKSLGRHQAGEEAAETRELIAEIISHFSL